MRVYDDWGNGFDLSARGYFGREEQRLPAVRQVVLQADHPGEVADFFKSKLASNIDDLSYERLGQAATTILRVDKHTDAPNVTFPPA